MIEDQKEVVEIDESNYETTMEVNFRLDPNGRTLPPEVEHDSGTGQHHSDIPLLDYTTRILSTHFERINFDTTVLKSDNDDDGDDSSIKNASLDDEEEATLIDALLFDCDIADSCLMPRTFWMDHTIQPRCNLEQMALDILQQHCPDHTNIHQCGAEWWVQIRPAPEATSRYTAPSYGSDNDIGTSAENITARTEEATILQEGSSDFNSNTSTEGISFHWDKDEDLRLLCNGTVYIHPHLSTVTYLTDGGDYAAPTFIAENVRINNLTGKWINNEDDNNQPIDEGQHAIHEQQVSLSHSTTTAANSAFISWTSKGKHLCFDGRYLHAAPLNLILKQSNLNSEPSNTPTFMIRRRRRYTFLVNIWMYHHPLNVHAFPESMIDKMSGSISGTSKQRIRLALSNTKQDNERRTQHQKNVEQVTTVTVQSDDTIQVSESNATVLQNESNVPVTDVKEKSKQFTWPMGDNNSNETIHVSIPIDTVQSKNETGGNVRIHWKNPFIISSCSKNNRLGMFLKNMSSEPRDVCKNDGNDCPREPDSKRPRVEGIDS